MDINKIKDFFYKNIKNKDSKWVKHSEYCAEGAKLIAEKTKTLDPELAYIMGLIHDIGKTIIDDKYGHLLEGYQLLNNNEFYNISRVCISHGFPLKYLPETEIEKFKNKNDFYLLESLLNKIEYDEYDMLIQLSDCFSIPDGYCLIEKRLVHAALKYGTTPWTSKKWEEIFKIKNYFENLIKDSIYNILPGVIKNTFNN